MRMKLFAIALTLAVPSMGWAQDETLADIRAQLSALFRDVQSLSAELTANGAATGVAGSNPLERIEAINAELTRLTAKTEELEFRIGRIVADGTNRIGDLEFRLCELEPTCDIGTLGVTSTLGGDPDTPAPTPAPVVTPGPQLAVGETADFEAAMAAFEGGDFQAAADQFASFVQKYPGGPMNQQAHYLRGEAYESLGSMTDAARAYLDAFSLNQSSELAPDALFKLGFSLGALGQTQDACITLAQVGVRFPNSDASLDAASAQRNLGCS